MVVRRRRRQTKADVKDVACFTTVSQGELEYRQQGNNHDHPADALEPNHLEWVGVKMRDEFLLRDHLQGQEELGHDHEHVPKQRIFGRLRPAVQED